MTTDPLVNASDATLARAVEENLFALCRTMATMPGGEIMESEQVNYHLTPPDAPMFKGVWSAHFSADEIDNAIEHAIAWFQARNAPFAAWWYNNRPQPENLLERLQAHGFELEYDAPGMAIALDDIDDAWLSPNDLTIVPVLDDKTLQDWVTALCATYGMPLVRAQAWTEGTKALGLEKAPWRLYVGYSKGQPVATNFVFNGAGVAGLYCVGTVPDARGKGFGAAITLKPLLDARKEGYRYGVLFASGMGLPLYKRIGFHPVDIRIGRYIWHNEA